MLLLFLGFILGTLGSWIASHLLPSPSDIRSWHIDALSRYANWRAKRSVQTAQKRILKLEQQLENDRKYVQNPTSFIASIIQDFFDLFSFVVFTIFILFLVVLPTLFPQQIISEASAKILMRIGMIFVVVLIFFAGTKQLTIFRRLTRLKYFENYGEWTQHQIEDLRNYILKNQEQT